MSQLARAGAGVSSAQRGSGSCEGSRHRAPQRRPRGLLPATILLALLAGCSLPPRRAPPAVPPAVPPPVAPLPPPPPDLDALPDAVPRSEPRARLGNPPFYEALGRRYVLLASAEGYVERGVASWYGPKFHGVSTSAGERYDMYAMTAAHKTLPIPCYVRVTNLRNGRSVVVRVNDRGPFLRNRLIDLSYSAALKLDMVQAGTAFVEVRAVAPEASSMHELANGTGAAATAPPGSPATAAATAAATAGATGAVTSPDPTDAGSAPPPALAAVTSLYVQAGAFAEELNATRLVERLRGAGLAHVFVGRKTQAERTLFRVRLGPVASVEEFDRLVARLAVLGIPNARLALD